MRKTRFVIGVIAGALMVFSGAAHSLMGWKQARHILARTTASADFSDGLAVPWHFAGVAMVMSGVIVIAFFISALRGRPESRFAVLVIGAAWLLFAIWGATFVKPDPSFAIFGLPGILVLIGALGASSIGPRYVAAT